MSRRKQQNPQHVNENPTPGQTNQSCFNEKTFFCNFGKKPDRFQGGDRNGEESRGACEDNSHNLQSASRADVDSDCSSDAASMADLGVDDNDGDGKPKMLRGADAFSQNSPSQNIHNDDTLDGERAANDREEFHGKLKHRCTCYVIQNHHQDNQNSCCS